MILVCPSCDSKFKVPDNAIPPAGRKVRCAQCGSTWHATTADELKPPKPTNPAVSGGQRRAPAAPQIAPVAEVDAGTAARAAAIRQSVVEPDDQATGGGVDENLFDEGIDSPASGAVSNDEPGEDNFELADGIREQLGDNFDLEPDEGLGVDEDLDDDDGGDDIMARRRGELRRDAERKSLTRKRGLIQAGWVALLLFVLGVLGSFLFMKETVTAAYPGTNQLYDFFAATRSNSADKYLPAEGERVTPPITETEVYVRAGVFENQTRIEVVEGQRFLVISAQLENTGNRAANVPKVEITVVDNSERTVDQWVYDPPGLVIRRLSKLRFEIRRPAPYGVKGISIKALEGTKSNNEAPSQL